MGVGLYRLGAKAKVVKLGTVSLADGVAQFAGFHPMWKARLEKGVEAEGKTVFPADGQAFLDALLKRYHGDYLWAYAEASAADDAERSIGTIERVVSALATPITKALEVLGKREPPVLGETHIHMPAQPVPKVDVHVPKSDGLEKALADLADRPAPSVVVNVPQRPPAQITVEGPEITVESPKVDVHVPEQPTPQVTVEPQITVESPKVEVRVEAELKMPDKETETETVVERDEMGRIISTRKRTRKARRP